MIGLPEAAVAAVRDPLSPVRQRFLSMHTAVHGRQLRGRSGLFVTSPDRKISSRLGGKRASGA